MTLTITPTALPEVLLVEPRCFGDARGFFMESWNQQRFDAAVGREVRFVQDNHSRSARGVLRGLHFQRAPRGQAKLVRVTSGAVWDVAVDLRRDSPRRGRWVGHELSADNHRQLWIPEGFAHGFLVLSAHADFLYKTTDYWAPECEGAVRWDDPALAIDWPRLDAPPQVSDKDRAAPAWAEVDPL